jgi:hypothetical protein
MFRDKEMFKLGTPVINLVGQKFGKLTVLERAPSRPNVRGAFWKCKCDCNLIIVTAAGDLKRGHTTQCRLCAIEQRRVKNTTHGDSQTRLYDCWKAMKRRCEDEKQDGYKFYGARGIKVCEDWHDYFKFRNWALQNGFEEDLEIDRIDSYGNYEPSNCKWSTELEQQRNRRNNVSIMWNGETHILIEWSEMLGIKLDTLHKRLYKYNWSVDRAFTTPVRSYKS